MRFDDVFDDGQTEPAAFRVVNQPRADAVELLEDPLMLRLRNADALIGDLDGDIAAAPADTHFNSLRLVRIPNRIIDQVENGLRQRFTVDHRWRQIRVNTRLRFEAGAGHLALVALHYLSDDFGDVVLGKLVLAAAGLNSGEVQDVVDQSRQATTFAVDNTVVLV